MRQSHRRRKYRLPWIVGIGAALLLPLLRSIAWRARDGFFCRLCRKRNCRQIREVPLHIELHRGSGLCLWQKSPDGQSDQPNRNCMAQDRGEKRTPWPIAANPFHAQVFAARNSLIARYFETRQCTAQTRTKLFPARHPVDAQVEPRQSRMNRRGHDVILSKGILWKQNHGIGNYTRLFRCHAHLTGCHLICRKRKMKCVILSEAKDLSSFYRSRFAALLSVP